MAKGYVRLVNGGKGLKQKSKEKGYVLHLRTLVLRFC